MPVLLHGSFSPTTASPLRLRSVPAPGRARAFLRRAPLGAGPPRRLPVALAGNDRVVLGCGLLTLDYLAAVDAYPRPDDKIRTGGLQISGGGDAGNALTGAARLGLNTRLISKVANDEFGETVLLELKEAGIDTSHVIISDGGNTTFSFVIIDKETKTRTCIITSGNPPMVPSDLTVSSLSGALQDVKLLFLDGYSHEMALAVAKQADQMNIPILVDAEPERTKAELEGLLSLSRYIVCSGKFPKKWTSISSIPCALLEILLQYPRARFVIVTLGENGCIMLERSKGDDSGTDVADIENVAESLQLELHRDNVLPTCVSTKFMRLSAEGTGSIFGRLLIGTAESIPASESSLIPLAASESIHRSSASRKSLHCCGLTLSHAHPRRCRPKRCCRLPVKWRASSAARSARGPAYPGSLIHAWPSSCASYTTAKIFIDTEKGNNTLRCCRMVSW